MGLRSTGGRARRQSRVVAAMYGGLAATILAVIATVALVLQPPSPPAVAEFVPREPDRIEAAPSAQSSRFGAGGNGECFDAHCDASAPAASTTTTTAAPREQARRPVLDRARMRRCVAGDPPRQTEDPQSPPCVNYFEGDNGGATSKGVTRDEIRVAVPNGDDSSYSRYPEELIAHFNQRYEFYGRRIRLVGIPSDGSQSDNQQVVATAADEEAHAFAVLPRYNYAELDMSEVQREAARRGLISVVGWTTHADQALLQQLAPYAWTYGPAVDEIEDNLGQFVCTSLAGRKAEHAGVAERAKDRRFAVFASKSKGRALDPAPLLDALARCNIRNVRVFEINSGDGQAAATYAALQQDQVTTILGLADVADLSCYSASAPKGYEPEFVIAGLASHDHELQWTTCASAQAREHLFGLLAVNKLLPAQDTPSWWAYQEAGAENLAGDPTVDRAKDYRFHMAYRQLLLLASGIQLAGPNLTPQTFAAGLQKARFPNPGAGGPPYYQAHVGFGPGDFSMADGASAVWWSNATESYGGLGWSQTGGWCYVRRGARFNRNWTDLSSEFFDPDPRNCR